MVYDGDVCEGKGGRGWEGKRRKGKEGKRRKQKKIGEV
jgi:hypothetical protein